MPTTATEIVDDGHGSLAPAAYAETQVVDGHEETQAVEADDLQPAAEMDIRAVPDQADDKENENQIDLLCHINEAEEARAGFESQAATTPASAQVIGNSRFESKSEKPW